MGCQTDVELGSNLTFTICTHDPDTGHLTDADAPPVYRVYEDETGAAILNGTMTLLDDVNTTGFYSEQIACTIANGFEENKSYNIYIAATVDADTGGISYGFRIHIKTGYRLSATGVDDILDEAVEGAYTLRQAVEIMLAVLAGRVSGGGTVTVTFRDANNVADRVVATVTAAGNRTNVVLTP